MFLFYVLKRGVIFGSFAKDSPLTASRRPWLSVTILMHPRSDFQSSSLPSFSICSKSGFRFPVFVCSILFAYLVNVGVVVVAVVVVVVIVGVFGESRILT